MPLIHLTTFIAAPVDRVFDLSRSIGLHRFSMDKHGEQAIAGKISGLMELNDSVTWKARHLFRERSLQTKITQFSHPVLFVDEQVRGDFKKMKHEHFFKACDNGTIMIDQFYFDAPYGVLGKWLNALFLESYVKKLLEQRNAVIKSVAESNQWKHYLTEKNS